MVQLVESTGGELSPEELSSLKSSLEAKLAEAEGGLDVDKERAEIGARKEAAMQGIAFNLVRTSAHMRKVPRPI